MRICVNHPDFLSLTILNGGWCLVLCSQYNRRGAKKKRKVNEAFWGPGGQWRCLIWIPDSTFYTDHRLSITDYLPPNKSGLQRNRLPHVNGFQIVSALSLRNFWNDGDNFSVWWRTDQPSSHSYTVTWLTSLEHPTAHFILNTQVHDKICKNPGLWNWASPTQTGMALGKQSDLYYKCRVRHTTRFVFLSCTET